MGDFAKLGKLWVITAIICKLAIVVVFVVAIAFVSSDGGTFVVSWKPGVSYVE